MTLLGGAVCCKLRDGRFVTYLCSLLQTLSSAKAVEMAAVSVVSVAIQVKIFL
jgi:hypothetical protein